MTSMVMCVQCKSAVCMYLVNKCRAVECVPYSFLGVCLDVYMRFNTFFVAFVNLLPCHE